MVWGRLRGAVEAGTEIGDAATICALEMAPMQIRIAEQGNYAAIPARETPAGNGWYSKWSNFH